VRNPLYIQDRGSGEFFTTDFDWDTDQTKAITYTCLPAVRSAAIKVKQANPARDLIILNSRNVKMPW
jgi:hypothetical protein